MRGKSPFDIPEKPAVVAVTMAAFVLCAFLISAIAGGYLHLCPRQPPPPSGDPPPSDILLDAVVHYATSKEVPQQSQQEIAITYSVIKRYSAPVNLLVFGLGRDSLMWAALNHRGTTVFLEEDPTWLHKVTSKNPSLHAHHVKYRTRLKEADELLLDYNTEPSCYPTMARLAGNTACKLALAALPRIVYDTEWDLIMIDAPRGYFPEAPGRMAAIYSAAVMARGRKTSNVTHVFLHDVDRPVEKMYAEKFLCRRNLVNGVGRLWHFEIPPSPLQHFSTASINASFC